MNAVVDSKVVTISKAQDPMVQAILLLLDSMRVPPVLLDQYRALRDELLGADDLELEAAEFTGRVAGFNAQCQVVRERELKALRDAFGSIVGRLEKMSQSISATEMQAQSSFQGAQKTADAMERQIHDITYRLKISSSLDGMKVWMEQRLSILQARLDDYDALSSQQQTTLASQLQKLAKDIEAAGGCLSGAEPESGPATDSVYEDGLTGFDNRIGYEAAVQELLERHRYHTGRQSIMLICDIDHLGDINQRFGVAAGDEVIRSVARKLRSVVGSENYLARVGSDQFGILLLGTDIDSAHLVSDKICESVETMQVDLQGETVRVTVSCGYSEIRRSDTSLDIWSRSEAGLRQAKLAGGNCCWFSDSK